MLAYKRVPAWVSMDMSVCSHLCTSVHPLLRVGACFCVFVSLCAHTRECCIFSLGRYRRLWRSDIAMKVDTKTGPGEGAGQAPPDTYPP